MQNIMENTDMKQYHICFVILGRIKTGPMLRLLEKNLWTPHVHASKQLEVLGNISCSWFRTNMHTMI